MSAKVLNDREQEAAQLLGMALGQMRKAGYTWEQIVVIVLLVGEQDG